MGIFIAITSFLLIMLLARPRMRQIGYTPPDAVIPLHRGEDTPERVAQSHMIAITEHIQHAQANVGAIRRYHAEEAQRILDSLHNEAQYLPFTVTGLIEAQAAISRLLR
ncbi:hypothetical protein VL04_17635 [Chromobacterium violaceum]|uniref:hypothetical protein n=1 Tax=Chromobacterium violaceum TaxID=536 RepID=UPI000653E0DE|nr:hypothetical protein [Chromobacterium violaceum]KMN48782.1 hypothetical protein VK93_14900 [Chromobacterium violaceum]KMN87877.1 hypothetical protein VL02_00895 [Chromobacterium violaceum]KMN89106.1 hypothetical protein VL04_17635 [Chromobacterium violaceum]KMO05480.1 hypothetical protein VL16_02880 [Chromobacterium violaceum]